MKKLTIIIIILLVVGAIWMIQSKQPEVQTNNGDKEIVVDLGNDEAKKDLMEVKVYFNKPILAAESCDDIQSPVTRTVPETLGVARAAILELLKGPTASESANDLQTSIPSGVILNKIEIENGTAYVDFNSELEQNAGGSCTALAIRAQIEDTLQQFSTVQNVVISINNRTEDILQP